MGGSLVIDSLTEDFESKRVLNLLSAPLRYWEIVIGKCAGSLAATIPHCIIWVVILSFTEHHVQNPLGIILFSILYSLFFILTGAALAIKLKKNRPAQMASTLVAVASIMLFSPKANAATWLIKSSPSYVFTRLAMGDAIWDFAWQMIMLLMIIFVSALALRSQTDHLDEVL